MYILRFSIDNFRSLKGVTIGQLNPITILHGGNDVGKSNILAALETIFKAKEHAAIVFSADGKRTEQRRTLGFWQGHLDDFRDNFYRDSDDPITFQVVVRFSPGELRGLVRSPDAIFRILRKANNPDDLVIQGRIVRKDVDSAEQELVQVKLNNKALYEPSEEGPAVYFSSLTDISQPMAYALFEEVMALLNNSFTVVPSRRYLTSERDMKGEPCALDATSFKNWLHNLDMDRDVHPLFEEIKGLFAGAPFGFGEISFAREEKNLEIMVQRPGLRLPIGRLGTGVQQILFLLASVVHNQGKMVGIEEMEINLSDQSQNDFLKTLDELMSSGKSAIRQIILTTHSYEYGKAGQVLRWFVDHDGLKTVIKPWDNEVEAICFSLRIGRLISRYSDTELWDLFRRAHSEEEVREILKRAALAAGS